MKARKAISYLLAVSCVSLLVAGAAMAQDQGRIATTLDTNYLSKFVWRGVQWTEDPVFQTSLKLALPTGFTYQMTGYTATESDSPFVAGKTQKIDHNVDYATSFMGYKLNLGWNYYSYPSFVVGPTQEVYVSVPFGGKFNPTVTANWDVQKNHGFYYTLAAGTSFCVPGLSNPLDLSVSVAYGDGPFAQYYYDAADQNAFLDANATVKTKIALGEDFALIPSITYTRMVDQDIRDSLQDPDNTVYGVALQASF